MKFNVEQFTENIFTKIEYIVYMYMHVVSVWWGWGGGGQAFHTYKAVTVYLLKEKEIVNYYKYILG